MELNYKKLSELAKEPTFGTEFSAGADLYAAVDRETTIMPHSTAAIGTGIAVEIPEGYFGGVFARSGLATKQGLRPANCTGVIDADYRGEVIVALHNDTNRIKTISPGERIAQLIIMPFLPIQFIEKDTLSDTVRGAGGFGSTGRK